MASIVGGNRMGKGRRNRRQGGQGLESVVKIERENQCDLETNCELKRTPIRDGPQKSTTR